MMCITGEKGLDWDPSSWENRKSKTHAGLPEKPLPEPERCPYLIES